MEIQNAKSSERSEFTRPLGTFLTLLNKITLFQDCNFAL
jgi:hypothetical protein